MHPNHFLKIVEKEARLRNLDDARLATQVVFKLLHLRITEDEAKDVKSQLPHDLALLWEGGEWWTERLLFHFAPHNRFDQEAFLNQVAVETLDLPAPPETVVRAVFYALQHQISPGEVADVAAQLPPDLRQIWIQSTPLPHPTGGGVPQESPDPTA